MKTKIKGYLKKLIKILGKPEMRTLPSRIAFYVILAIIPLLTIVVLFASYFNISIDLVSSLVSDVMPKQVSSIIIDVISGKGFDHHIGFFNVVAFVVACITAFLFYKNNVSGMVTITLPVIHLSYLRIALAAIIAAAIGIVVTSSSKK